MNDVFVRARVYVHVCVRVYEWMCNCTTLALTVVSTHLHVFICMYAVCLNIVHTYMNASVINTTQCHTVRNEAPNEPFKYTG